MGVGLLLFFLMRGRPPRSALLPATTLFRSTGRAITRAQPRVLMGGGLSPDNIVCGDRMPEGAKKPTRTAEDAGRAITRAQPRVLMGGGPISCHNCFRGS